MRGRRRKRKKRYFSRVLDQKFREAFEKGTAYSKRNGTEERIYELYQNLFGSRGLEVREKALRLMYRVSTAREIEAIFYLYRDQLVLEDRLIALEKTNEKGRKVECRKKLKAGL